MTIQRVELFSGVWLTAVQSRRFQSSHWSLHLLAPLRANTASLNALLPGVLRQGCQHYPSPESFSAVLEALDGDIRPSVQGCGEWQCFGFTAVFPDGSRSVQEAADLLGELLLRPATKNGRLLSDHLEQGKQQLLRLLEGEKSDWLHTARWLLLRQICAGEPLSVSPLGQPEEVRFAAMGRLFRQYQEMLSRCPVELYYCGSRPAEDIRRVWRSALAGLPRSQLFDRTPPLPLSRSGTPEQPQLFWEEWELPQCGLAMGFRTAVSMGDPMYPALLVANALLNQDVTSRLDGHSGLLTTIIKTEARPSEANRAELLARLQAIKDGSFTESRLSAAKQDIITRLDSISQAPLSLGKYWLHRAIAQDFLSPEELAELTSQITVGQAAAAAQEIQLDSSCYLIGPIA